MEGPYLFYSDFQQLTIDVIGEAAFGLDLNAQENPDDIFLQKAKATFEMANPANRPFIMSVGCKYEHYIYE